MSAQTSPGMAHIACADRLIARAMDDVREGRKGKALGKLHAARGILILAATAEEPIRLEAIQPLEARV